MVLLYCRATAICRQLHRCFDLNLKDCYYCKGSFFYIGEMVEYVPLTILINDFEEREGRVYLEKFWGVKLEGIEVKSNPKLYKTLNSGRDSQFHVFENKRLVFSASLQFYPEFREVYAFTAKKIGKKVKPYFSFGDTIVWPGEQRLFIEQGLPFVYGPQMQEVYRGSNGKGSFQHFSKENLEISVLDSMAFSDTTGRANRLEINEGLKSIFPIPEIADVNSGSQKNLKVIIQYYIPIESPDPSLKGRTVVTKQNFIVNLDSNLVCTKVVPIDVFQWLDSMKGKSSNFISSSFFFDKEKEILFYPIVNDDLGNSLLNTFWIPLVEKDHVYKPVDGVEYFGASMPFGGRYPKVPYPWFYFADNDSLAYYQSTTQDYFSVGIPMPEGGKMVSVEGFPKCFTVLIQKGNEFLVSNFPDEAPIWKKVPQVKNPKSNLILHDRKVYYLNAQGSVMEINPWFQK